MGQKKRAEDAYKKRLKKHLLSSKPGVLIATMFTSMVQMREQVRKGKMPLGLNPKELDFVLSNYIEGFIHLRDAYVEEKDPSPPGGGQQDSEANPLAKAS